MMMKKIVSRVVGVSSLSALALMVGCASGQKSPDRELAAEKSITRTYHGQQAEDLWGALRRAGAPKVTQVQGEEVTLSELTCGVHVTGRAPLSEATDDELEYFCRADWSKSSKSAQGLYEAMTELAHAERITSRSAVSRMSSIHCVSEPKDYVCKVSAVAEDGFYLAEN